MAFIAFLFTFIELVAAGVGYLLQSEHIFTMVVKYGSPVYLFRNLLGADSVLMSGNLFYIGMFVFHALKYAALFRTQMIGEGGKLFWCAVLFDACYLGLSAYYLF